MRYKDDSTDSAIVSDVGSVVLVLFVLSERRAEAPLLDLTLFLRWQYLAVAIVALIGNWASAVMIFYVPQYLQNVLDLGATAAGAVFPGVHGAEAFYHGQQFAFTVAKVLRLALEQVAQVVVVDYRKASCTVVAAGNCGVAPQSALFEIHALAKIAPRAAFQQGLR